jgi:hypothetical protein
LRSRPFAWSGRRTIDEAIRCRQLQPITVRRTSESDVFATPRMRTLRGPSRALKSLHRTVSISDTLLSARRHARVGLRTARCATHNALLADGVVKFDLRAQGSRTTLPVKARWSVTRKCLPSCRESASRNPQTKFARLIRRGEFAYRFAFCPPMPCVKQCFGLLPG